LSFSERWISRAAFRSDAWQNPRISVFPSFPELLFFTFPLSLFYDCSPASRFSFAERPARKFFGMSISSLVLLFFFFPLFHQTRTADRLLSSMAIPDLFDEFLFFAPS